MSATKYDNMGFSYVKTLKGSGDSQYTITILSDNLEFWKTTEGEKTKE